MSIKVVTPSTLDELLAEVRVLPTPLSSAPANQYPVFRGVGVASWAMRHSLNRTGGDVHAKEPAILEAFVTSAANDLLKDAVDIDNYLHVVTRAQHYGVPTRLLDWTKSVDVALHFATASREHQDDDGAVWVVNPHLVHQTLSSGVRTKLSPDRASDPPIIDQARVFEAYPSIADFDLHFILGSFTPAVFFSPPRRDERMINQKGVFSMVADAEYSLSDVLEKIDGCCTKVIVSSKLKLEARAMLDSQETDERGLFPGMDGVGRFLTRIHTQ